MYVLNVCCQYILEVRAVRFVRLETQRSNDRTARSKLTQSEVAEHRTDVLILVITTKLLEPDHRLGQLAVVTFLTWQTYKNKNPLRSGYA